MGGVHHFLTTEHAGSSLVHSLDPRAKLIGLVAIAVVSVSTPAQAVWAFAAYAGLLAFLVGLSKVPVMFILRRTLVVLPFVLIVAAFVPFFHEAGPGSYSVGGVDVSREGLLVLWNVAAKAAIGVVAMILLGSTTSLPEITAGMERLRVPRLFTLIISFMYRYIFVLIEELRRMRRAMISRNYQGRWLWDAGVLGHLISSLFLRSYDRGERVYVAMVSRGYNGVMAVSAPLRFARRDLAFLGILIGFLGLLRLLVSFQLGA